MANARRVFTKAEDRLIALAHRGEIEMRDLRALLRCGWRVVYGRMDELGLGRRRRDLRRPPSSSTLMLPGLTP